MNAQRLVDAAIHGGVGSPAARLLVDILEAADDAALAASTLADPMPSKLAGSALLPAFPEFERLIDVTRRDWLVA
jgi:hypothetical protein